jgi:hypothetical protein
LPASWRHCFSNEGLLCAPKGVASVMRESTSKIVLIVPSRLLRSRERDCGHYHSNAGRADVKYVTQTIELIVAAADTMAAFAQELAALERHP